MLTMKYPRTLKALWIILVVLWIGTAMELKSLVLSKQWGSSPGPGLMTVSLGSQQFLVPTWIGYAFNVACYGFVVLVVVILMLRNRKK